MRRCTVCMHPDRKAIEKQIISGIPISTLARQYQLGRDALFRPRDEHLTPQLRGAATRSLKNHTDDLFNELLELAGTTKDILRSALDDNHRGLALKSVQQARNNIEVLTRFVISMEEIQLKQNTIEVQEEQSNSWLVGGYKRLSPADQRLYENLIYKMIELTGGNFLDEDTDQDPTDELYLDQEDFSLKPRPVPPKRKQPGSGGPTRRINPPRQE